MIARQNFSADHIQIVRNWQPGGRYALKKMGRRDIRVAAPEFRFHHTFQYAATS